MGALTGFLLPSGSSHKGLDLCWPSMSARSLAVDRWTVTVTAYLDLHGTMGPTDNHTWPQAFPQNPNRATMFMSVNVAGSNSRKQLCFRHTSEISNDHDYKAVCKKREP